MKSFDLNAYDKRVFDAIAKLINERDPRLGEDEIEREALDLMGDHVRAASVLSLSGPKSERSELEQLEEKSRELADALESLSFQAQLELRYISGSAPLPDLKRLQLDAAELANALWEGLKKRPPPDAHRSKDVRIESLIAEAVNVFEKAMGIRLKDLPKPESQKSRDMIHKLNQFVRNHMPIQSMYESDSEIDSLSTRVRRYRENHIK